MSIEALKKQRGVVKGKLTRFKNFIEEPTNREKVGEIRERLNKLEAVDREFEAVQDSIEALISEDANALQAEKIEHEAFENEYYRLLAVGRDLITPRVEADRASRANSVTSDVTQRTAGTANIFNHLPTLRVPPFDGDLSKWIKFRDTFNSLVHSQTSLSKIDKFNYLSNALEGEAARAIQSLGISEANYERAWEKIQERYENSDELVEYHTQAFCELSPMGKGSYSDLRRIIDDASNHLAALKTLGQATGSFDSLLIYILGKKLDDETKRSWDRVALSTKGKRTLSDFTTHLENQCKYLQRNMLGKQTQSYAGGKGHASQNNTGNGNKFQRKPNQSVAAHAATTTACPQCKDNHPLYFCGEFKALDIPARFKRAKELKVCFNCLSADHSKADCTSGPCKKCNLYHNTLLHFNKRKNGQESKPNEQIASPPTALTAQSLEASSVHVLLGTAIVQIADREGRMVECRALLDSGSQVHFITQELSKRLKLSSLQSETTVSGIDQATIELKYRTQVKLQSKTSGFKTTITCLITPRITSNMPNIKIDRMQIALPAGIVLADPQFDKTRPVDLLIGAGLFWDLLCIGQIKTARNQPYFQKTKLGWIVTGTLDYDETALSKRVSCHMVTNTELHSQVEKFWALEDCTAGGGAPALDLLDPCEQQFLKTTKRDANGRFIVSLPFNENKDKLGDSYRLAEKRLLSMESKFLKNSGLKEKYVAFMKEYEELNHMTIMTEGELNQNTAAYYLPHHAVFKEESTTTKLRVVFDGSAKTTSKISLNDTQHTGYEVQDELFNILIRFRKHKIVIGADAAKMYRQIQVQLSDRDYQRILWRYDASHPMQTYRLNTVTYGTRAAAYLAKRSLRQLGEECKISHPQASKVIINDFYVDDLLTGADNVDEARQLKENVTKVLAAGCLDLRKWASNESQIIENTSVENVSIQAADKDPKTLGLRWNTNLDELTISVKPQEKGKVSKRTILSQIAQIFDPLGLVAPAVVKAKIILQRVWQLQLNWDESLPQDLHTIWLEFREKLIDLNKIKIPRRALGNSIKHLELHGFSDASEVAFGACIYVRTTTTANYHTVHLICAKSRVAPLKKVTLPRLELCGAVLLAQLVDKVSRALDIKINNQYYWSDSTIALSWIKGQPGRWKTFVANRTSEIQRLTNNNWSHVLSEDNPADLVSRGIDPSQLTDSRLWWKGPLWLSQESSAWPAHEVECDISEMLLEERPQKVITLTATSEKFNIFERFSSWALLTRVVAYCRRFYAKIRKAYSGDNAGLTGQELQQAQYCLIKLAQEEALQQELQSLKKGEPLKGSSKLLSLQPFIDSNGLIRVGGRLQHAPVTYDQKHPIVLPRHHQLTWMIIQYEHQRLLHAGCQAVMSSLRIRYWPIAAGSMVKKVVKKCVICVRLRAATTKYIMGDLPASRVTPVRPFLVCGVDYAGPLYLKEKTRSKTTTTAYICIFVCFATKAIHIELAHDLSTDAFLNCLRRFISRRGRCQKLYSDNGTNFVGAKNELNELGYLLTSKEFRDKVESYASKEHMSWHMNPPHAPHFGGLWESAVKSTKFHLKRVIGETRLTFEEMYTILTQIEACLNSRPLSPLSDDVNDLTPLTPAHFIIGESLMALPEADVREIQINRLGRYQHLQYMVQHFWQRWQKEYLHGLQQRSKWNTASAVEWQPGVMVIIRDDNLPPTKWRLGRIVEVTPGHDKIVRVVSVKTIDGVILRPVTKIVRLPIESSSDTLAEGSAPGDNDSNDDKSSDAK